MKRNRKSLTAFSVLSVGLLHWIRGVRADVINPPSVGGTSVSSDTLIIAGIVVSVIAVSSYLLLRRIRENSRKNVSK
jgi:hypothetical protein